MAAMQRQSEIRTIEQQVSLDAAYFEPDYYTFFISTSQRLSGKRK